MRSALASAETSSVVTIDSRHFVQVVADLRRRPDERQLLDQLPWDLRAGLVLVPAEVQLLDLLDLALVAHADRDVRVEVRAFGAHAAEVQRVERAQRVDRGDRPGRPARTVRRPVALGVGRLVGGIANPASSAVWLVAAAAAFVIAWSISSRRRAAFGWGLVAGYAVCDILLVAFTRAAIVGPAIGSEYRYSTDLALITILSAALAFLPLRTDFVLAEPQLLRTRESSGSVAASVRSELGPVDGPTLRRTVTAVVVVLFAISCFDSTMGYADIWHPTESRTYVQTAVKQLSTQKVPLKLIDSALPDNVMWGLSFPDNLVSHVFAEAKGKSTVLEPGQSAGSLYMLDQSGFLRLTAVNGAVNKPGPEPVCGWRVNDEPVSIPLNFTTYDWTWYIRIGYIASQSSPAVITAGRADGGNGEVRVNALYLMGTGKISSIDITGLRGTASMCTNEVHVGYPSALPGTHP